MLPFFSVGALVLLFVIPCNLLVEGKSEYSCNRSPLAALTMSNMFCRCFKTTSQHFKKGHPFF